MRLPSIIYLFALTVIAGFAAERYIAPESWPRLHIKSVLMPREPSQPLWVGFELAAEGKTPVAISQDQFSVDISTRKRPYVFIGRTSFPTNSPRVFTVHPQKPIMLTATSSTNEFAHGLWSDLRPGKYRLRVYINSGKTREFDYQWLGQTYSDDYDLTIK